VTCRVLGFCKQAFDKWKAKPVSDRDYDDVHLIDAAVDIHHDDPEFGYRFIPTSSPPRAGRSNVRVEQVLP
jgi:putative transposase